MTTSREPADRFQSTLIGDLDEPVRRFFTHALREGAPLAARVRLTTTGRIKVGTWLPFTAEQNVDGRSFLWQARVGWGPFTLLGVRDRYADGTASTELRLWDRLRVLHRDDTNTVRSAAGRTALESVVFAPASVLPARGVLWRAESEDVIVARFDLPPEYPEVHARIDERGALRTVSALRWGNASRTTFDYIPCGCQVHTERDFGDVRIPSSLTVGWWFDTPRYTPFFQTKIHHINPES